MSSPITYTPKDIDIKSCGQGDKDITVGYITVSGIKILNSIDAQGNTLVHWRLGCAWGEIERGSSVAIDTRKLKTDPVIELQLISKKFFISTVAACNIIFPAMKLFTSMDVLNLIMKYGYHCYLYDNNGSGCLFWTRTVLCMLEKEGLIEAGSLERFDKEVDKTRSKQGLWVPYDKGTFFNPDGSL